MTRDEKSPSNGTSFCSSAMLLLWYMSNEVEAVLVLDSRLFLSIETNSRFELIVSESINGSEKKSTSAHSRSHLLLLLLQ